MTIFLGILYSFLFCYIIVKSQFAAATQLSKTVLIAAFVIKLIAAFAYGYIHYTSRQGVQSDTWKLFYQSQLETPLLFKNPMLFLQSIFGNGYQHTAADVLSTTNNYWNDLKHNVLLFIMSVCNVFSKSNYYVNVIIFNFLTFWGSIALYRFVFKQLAIPKKLLIAIVFFFPTLLFWSSGFHKEGILFAGISFILFTIQHFSKYTFSLRYILVFIISLLFVLILRNYILLFLFPFLLLWIFAEKIKFPNLGLVYLLSAILFISGFLFSGNITTQFNLLQITSTVQHDFLQLPANTSLNVPKLNASIASFTAYLPIALQAAFIEPFTQLKSINMLPSLMENCILLFAVLFVIFNKKYWIKNNTAFMLICFSFFTILFLGYTIPIIGAIIRYKSIITPFMLLGLLGLITWENKFWKRLS